MTNIDIKAIKKKDERSIVDLFQLYDNVLEMQLRYRQPVSSSLGPITNQLSISKYLFSSTLLWGLSTQLTAYSFAFSMITIGKFLSHAASNNNSAASTHTSSSPENLMFLGILTGLFFGLLFAFLFVFSLIWLGTAFYFALIASNLYIAWKKETLSALRGPTHISFSPISIKLIWQGALFTNIGLMFGWDEIISADLSISQPDQLTNLVSVIITVQKGKTTHILPIRLDGFASAEERYLLLHSINRHLPEECKSQTFKDYLSNEDKLNLLLSRDNIDFSKPLVYEQEGQRVLSLLSSNSKDNKIDQSIITTDDKKDLVYESIQRTEKQKDSTGL